MRGKIFLLASFFLLVSGNLFAGGKFHYGTGEGAGVQVSLPLQKEVYRVRHVIDGDTLELENGERVRYIGIDTPEPRRREGDRWVEEPEPYAEEATQANRKLLEGKKVRLEFDQKHRDEFGRLLAYVYVRLPFFGEARYDGEVVLDSHEIFVNAYLIQKGLAKPFPIPPNLRYAERFEGLALRAKKQGLGLWTEKEKENSYARER